MKPITKYTKSGRINIAYQVFGDGAIDMVYVPGWVSNIDLMWDNPELVHFFTELTKFARLILFDKRGTGLSDRVMDLSPIEDRMDDIRAVMDAEGVEKAALFGHSEGGSVCALFAATYPERTLALLTFGVFAKRRYSEDYPWAPTDEERQEVYDMIEKNWGSGDMDLASLAPSRANDKVFMDWLARYFRSGASPSAALVLTQMNTKVDIIDILDSIEVPTLLMYRTNDIDVKIDEGRFISERIKKSKFVEFKGSDHLFWVGDTSEVINEITVFLKDVKPKEKYNRQLATILFSDIVDSTKLLHQFGDIGWMELLQKHNQCILDLSKQYRGRIIKKAGDGFLIVFEGPSKAVHCGLEIINKIKPLNIKIRIGIHIGECIFSEDDITGMAVHIASRVQECAEGGEIVITETVKNLLYGTGLEFKAKGPAMLKGIENHVNLLSVKDSEQDELDLANKQTISINNLPQNHSFLENVLQSIENHIDNEEYTVEQLCKDVGLSERQLQRKLKATANKSPNQLIRSVRLHKAKEYLIMKDENVSDVAFKTGFTNMSYFTKCFKAEFGMMPSEMLSKSA